MRMQNILRCAGTFGFVTIVAAAGCGAAPDAGGHPDEQATSPAALAAGGKAEAAARSPSQGEARTAPEKGEPTASAKGSAPNESNLLLNDICECPAGTTNCGLPGWLSAGPYCSTYMGCGPETSRDKPTRGPAMLQTWSRLCIYYDYCLDQTDDNGDGIPDDLSWGWGGNCRDGYTQPRGPALQHCDCD
ncbi:MAG TPA: hypothetical protein VK540_35525 [Polyangiaceae bacterium]|nr:hypothetical protein [Polyangiaceae bacterium]